MKKFGIVDIIIILLVVAIGFAGYMFISEKEASTSGSIADVEFTVELKMLTEEEAEVIAVGDEVTDSIKGGYYGEVCDVEIKKATAISSNTLDGAYSVVEYPDKYDVYVKVHGTPTTMNDSSIKFASQEIKIGTLAYLKNEKYVGSGYVVGLDILE